MKVYVAADVLFLKNFILSMFIILLAGVLLERKPIIRRLVGSSVLWSLAVLLCMFGKPEVRKLLAFFTEVVMAWISVTLTYRMGIRDGITAKMFTIFFSAFYGSGIFQGWKAIWEKDFFFAPLGLILGYIGLYVGKKHLKAGDLYTVSFQFRGQEIQVKAFLDSGNFLKEPISKRPVSVIQKNIIPVEEGMPEVDKGERFYMIPYRSVGKAEGILPGTLVRNVRITNRNCSILCEEMLIAIYAGVLSAKGNYEMLLNKEYLK